MCFRRRLRTEKSKGKVGERRTQGGISGTSGERAANAMGEQAWEGIERVKFGKESGNARRTHRAP